MASKRSVGKSIAYLNAEFPGRKELVLSLKLFYVEFLTAIKRYNQRAVLFARQLQDGVAAAAGDAGNRNHLDEAHLRKPFQFAIDQMNKTVKSVGLILEGEGFVLSELETEADHRLEHDG